MIYKKLDVLKQGEIIDEPVFNYTLKVIAILEQEGFDVQSDKAQVFITHLAMATMRLLKNEQLAPLDPAIQADLESQSVFKQAEQIWGKLVVHSPVPFIPAEEGYVYIHMCSLLSN